MASARSQIVQPGQFGHFHVVVRCVQQLFLCGRDRSSGKNHQHRRQWIEDRIHALGEIFAVSVHSYAVMSNHLHLVLSVDPEVAARWDDFEVAHRAAALYRRRGENDDAVRGRALSWSDQSERIAILRQRLGDLGEYMKALNEFIAKKANKESGRKGNFWDDRYKCQRLEDDGALLSAMVYVDLNPIRAKMASDLGSSNHTSAKRRIEQIRSNRRLTSQPLLPVAGPKHRRPLDLTQAGYLELADQTGRQLHPGKRGKIAFNTPPLLKQLHLNELRWLTQVRGIESRYWRAVGSVDSLLRLAEQLNQKWVRGLVGAKALARLG